MRRAAVSGGFHKRNFDMAETVHLYLTTDGETAAGLRSDGELVQAGASGDADGFDFATAGGAGETEGGQTVRYTGFGTMEIRKPKPDPTRDVGDAAENDGVDGLTDANDSDPGVAGNDNEWKYVPVRRFAVLPDDDGSDIAMPVDDGWM